MSMFLNHDGTYLSRRMRRGGSGKQSFATQSDQRLFEDEVAATELKAKTDADGTAMDPTENTASSRHLIR